MNILPNVISYNNAVYLYEIFLILHILRHQGEKLAFVELSDGTIHTSLQVVCLREKTGAQLDALIQHGATGAAVMFKGEIVASPAHGQHIEM